MDPLLLVVLGPTASGKTALALRLAQEFGGEIVSCDSVAMYREFEIGTAKPSQAERRLVPHHLIDVVEPTAQVTAGEYARLARAAIEQIHRRGKVPIVAGGTGLYLRALLEGLFPGPHRSEDLRARLRERVTEKGAAYLHRVLRRMDGEAATRIHANDTAKVIRAIEVCLASRQKLSTMWEKGRDALVGFRILRLGLDPERARLYERINQRARLMFAAGLVAETRGIVEKYGAAAWPLSSLGYKQAVQVLRGERSEADALAEAQQAHRNYAKRQMTWFRKEPQVHWLKGFGDEVGAQAVKIVSSRYGQEFE